MSNHNSQHSLRLDAGAAMDAHCARRCHLPCERPLDCLSLIVRDKAREISVHSQLNPRLHGHLQQPRLATSSPSRSLHELARNVASRARYSASERELARKLNLHRS